MVSSVSSLFRNRRSRPSATLPKSASTPATIPTVEITEPIAEEPMTSTATEEIAIPSSLREEISEEKLTNGSNGEMKIVVVETDEEVAQCGCAEVLQNGLQKVKETIEEIPPEYKEAARYSGLATASLAGLFFSVVLYRIAQHLFFGEEQSFFCSYFSRPFSPLFDALCHPEYPGILKDFVHEARHLGTEVVAQIDNFFASIFAGFRAFGTIFWALFGGIFHVFADGVGELWENVTENISFLLKFLRDFTTAILSIFYRMLAGTLDQLLIALHNIRNVLSGEQMTTSGWF